MEFFSCDLPHEALKVITARSRAGLSVRGLSKKLGYSSDRSLGMVLQGKRSTSSQMIEKISEYYSLSEKEKHFLRLLSAREKLKKNNRGSSALDGEIQSYRNYSFKKKNITSKEVAALSHWSSFTIVELLQVSKKALSLVQIKNLLDEDVPKKELKSVLDILVQYQFIGRNDNNLYVASLDDTYFYSHVNVPSQFTHMAYRRQMERSLNILDLQSVLDREVWLKTFSVPKSKIPQIKKMVRDSFEELSDRILSLKDESSSSEKNVYQMNIQFYRQSKDF